MCDNCEVNKVKSRVATKENGVKDVQLQQSDGMEKCKEWLESCCINDDMSTCSSQVGTNDEDDESVACSSTTDCSSEYSQVVSRTDKLTSTNNSLTSIGTDQLQPIISQNQNVYENILINNSKKVHLGNVTVINGPIYINKAKIHSDKTDKSKTNDKLPEDIVYANAGIRWIDRRAWVAQPPIDEYTKIKKPAKFVIICHSATEDATIHAENILLVRYIQQFHIDCRNFIDIGYNFLIGCDGYTYKGRGWGVDGAHSFRYNSISVGICIVGTFCTKLPTQIALDQAKTLIKYGVKHGEIDEDYCLIGNCQVSSTKSPGELLFEEIKTWDHYDPSVSLENPSPLIEST